MTAARQPAKWLPLLILLTFGLGNSAERLSAEPAVIVSATTGLAISGFDPVAYFADDKALPGKPELELDLQGGECLCCPGMQRRRGGGRIAAEKLPVEL